MVKPNGVSFCGIGKMKADRALYKHSEISYIRIMIRRLQPLLVVFFLAVFLTPSVVKELHAVCHEEEFHCEAKSEAHLHAQHHSCDLCDFVIPVVSVSSSFRTQFSLTNFAEYIFSDQVEICFSASQFSSALLRAPPCIS